MKPSPNVVLIIADDHRYESVGANGNREVSTPNLDALAAAGTAFDGAYCQGSMHPAVCVPSRASLLTGRNIFAASQDPTGRDYERSAFAIPHDLPTYPERLRAHGYHTHAIGKWHNDKAAFARSFSSGDKLMFGGMSDHDKVPLRPFDPTGAYPDEAIHFEPELSTEIFRKAAVDFLKSHDRSKPFLLQVAFTAPHDPRTPPPQHRVSPGGLSLPENLAAVHPFDNGEMLVRDEVLEAFPRTPEAIRGHLADYYGMISHLDDAIGSILKTLDALGLADDTIVVYTADHGLALGQHGLLGKQNLYEHSLHVPLIMRGPGIRAGARVPHLVWHADTTATILDLAGLAPDPEGEGTSLLPLLGGDDTGPLRDGMTAAYTFVQRMARDERYKLILYLERPDEQMQASAVGQPTRGSRAVQLFDLVEDPGETTNLAFLPRLAEVRENLLVRLLAWQERVGDPLAAATREAFGSGRD